MDSVWQGRRGQWGRFLSIGILVAGLGLGCQRGDVSLRGGEDDGVLEIWWSEGYYPEETEAIRQAVSDWSAETGIEANLLFYSEKDLIQQSESAIAAGNPPDILYGYSIDFALVPKLAWQGQLADTTDIVEPLEAVYSPEALESVSYQNNKAGNRSYYAVPISQQTTHIHYWKALLAEVGKTEADIPTEWSAFWQFWAEAQAAYQAETGREDVYGIGLPMSVAATDTTYQLEQFLEAYDVEIINPDGTLQVDDPKVRSGIITALTDYTQFYKDGDVPPNAIDWGDPDNNVTFLSRLTLMTPNPTMSIPGSQRQDEATYNEQMGTVLWPAKPSGEPMRYLSSTKQVAILANSKQVEEAKSFVAYLVQPDVLAQYIEGSQGRFFPVMPELLNASFWTDQSDPHTVVAAQQFTKTRPLATVYNPAYSQVQADNVWGQAVRSIVVDGVSPEDAADTAIAAIKQIFTDWE